MFCCLQEVRWRDIDSKVIQLDTGEAYEFHWSGYKKKREAGVAILIRVHPNIEINTSDVNEPRVIAINIKIYGFKLTVVNGYAPAVANCTENQKHIIYTALNKATTKTEKHHKLVVIGDFNVPTIILVECNCCFVGTNIIEDENYSDNGYQRKNLCRNKQLCMSSTFFKHRKLHRYTWYCNDGQTRKILDYILAEKYVQQYITDCRVMAGFDADSDHHLLKTALYTPSTRQARIKSCKNPKTPKLNIKALQNPDIIQKYTEAVTINLQNSSNAVESVTNITERSTNAIQSATDKLNNRRMIIFLTNCWDSDINVTEMQPTTKTSRRKSRNE